MTHLNKHRLKHSALALLTCFNHLRTFCVSERLPIRQPVRQTSGQRFCTPLGEACTLLYTQRSRCFLCLLKEGAFEASFQFPCASHRCRHLSTKVPFQECTESSGRFMYAWLVEHSNYFPQLYSSTTIQNHRSSSQLS